jgi:hypothetical protein
MGSYLEKPRAYLRVMFKKKKNKPVKQITGHKGSQFSRRALTEEPSTNTEVNCVFNIH